MTRVVVVGDLMTDTVAHAMLPLARGSDTPATVTMHGGGSGANVSAWLAADGADVAFIGRRGADIPGRNRDMELMGYGVDARLVMDPERPTGTCVVMVTHKGDHTMLSDPGANAALSPDDLPKDLFTPGRAAPRAFPAAPQRRDAALRERRPGQGADRPGAAGTGGTGAECLVPAGRDEARRRGRAVLRQRAARAVPGSRAAG